MLHGKLMQIEEGMLVVDRIGEKVGSVDLVRYSDEDSNKPGPETVSAGETPSNQSSWVDDLINVLQPHSELPEELKKRFQREGYLRIDVKGILAGERYVTLQQVKDVTPKQVTLNLTKDEIPSF